MRYLVGTLLLVLGLHAAQLDPRLAKNWATMPDDQVIGVIVHMAQKADLSSIPAADRQARLHYLQNFARTTQADLLQFLQAKQGIEELRPFWIINGVYLKAQKRVIDQILRRSDVAFVEKMDTVWLVDARRPNPAKEALKKQVDRARRQAELRAHALADASRPEPRSRSFNWNITIIEADRVWTELGILGDGVVVGNLDTGVDITHPVLQGKFLGYWYDGVNGQPTPYDDHGHGTHTMGTIVGGDGPGNNIPDNHDVGVAPGAMFVAAKGFSSGGFGEDPWILGCYEFFASLIDSGVDIRVVSNSWGSSDATDLTFWEATWNWRQLGIIPVFASGNSGPGAGTAGTPGNFPIVIGVGATNESDNIASFSSRGPAPNQNPWNDPQYWPRDDWNLIKPNISAPGEGVTSSVPGGGFETWDGTSMATPHVAGVIALMLSLNPTLDFETVYDILLNSADQPPQGGSYPNNDYGWGRVNAYQAVLNTPGLDAPFVRIVGITFDDASGNQNGQPDPGETVSLHLTLRNLGLRVDNVQVTLSTTDPTLNLIDATSYVGTLAQGDTATGDEIVFSSDPDRRPGLPAGFSVEITGTDSAGNPYTAHDTLVFAIGTPAYVTWYIETFESGLGNWTIGGSSNWGLSDTYYHSPTHSLSNAPSGDYGNNEDGFAQWNQVLDLTDAYYARLIFWHRYEIESGYDYGLVEVSTDGATWDQLASYSGSSGAMEAETLSLDAYAGQTVYLRFRFTSDGSVTRDGWYIDDIEVQKDVPLEGVHMSLLGTQVADTLNGDGDGVTEPGEGVYFFFSLQNIGTDDATGVQGTLFTDDSYISILDGSSDIGTVPGGGGVVTNAADPMSFQLDPETPMGHPYTLYLVVSSDVSVDTYEVHLTAARGGDYLIWELDPTPITGSVLQQIFDSQGLVGFYTTDLAEYLPDLPNFKSVWIMVGMYPNNERIPDGPEAQALVQYLENGGRVYLEGGDVWAYDPGAGSFDFGPYFGLEGVEDGSDDLASVLGLSGTFTEGFSFTYAGENSWVDHIQATASGAFNIFENSSPSYYCGVAYVHDLGNNEDYRTIGLSFELGGLQSSGSGTVEDLVRRMLEFFGVITDVAEGAGTTPRFAFAEPHPTLVRTTATLQFTLPQSSPVTLDLYDASGRRVKRLMARTLPAGSHTLTWTPKVSSGVYFLKLKAGSQTRTRKFVVLRWFAKTRETFGGGHPSGRPPPKSISS